MDKAVEKSFDPFNHNFYEYDLKIEIEEIKQIELFLKNINGSSSYHMSTTYNAFEILNLPLLKNLRAQIISILDQRKLILSNSWGQLYSKDNCHLPHTHSQSAYSGIIYLKITYDDPESGTYFYDNLTGNPYIFPFKEKKLLLFPSFFLHEVRPVKKEGERIVVSFNTHMKPDKGPIESL